MNLDFNNICRLCLRTDPPSIDLFPKNGVKDLSSEETKKMVEKINSCYHVQICPGDELPTKVCHRCIQIVSLFYLSQQNAANSEKLLKNTLLLKGLGNQEVVQNHNNSLEESTNETTENGKETENSNESLEINETRDILPNGISTEESQSISNSINKCETSKNISKVIDVSNENKRTTRSKRNKILLDKETAINGNSNHIDELSSRSENTENIQNATSVENGIVEDVKSESEEKSLESNKLTEIVEADKKSNVKTNLNKLKTSSLRNRKMINNKRIISKKAEVIKTERKSKKNNLDEYYQNLLNTDEKLKIEYCRLGQQKAKANEVLAAEKKKAQELNLKIYNLVKITLKIVNVVFENENDWDNPRMERVFDRLISVNGEFENFAKEKLKKMNIIYENGRYYFFSDVYKNERNENELNGDSGVPTLEESSAGNSPGKFHEKTKSKWSDLNLSVTDKGEESFDETRVKPSVKSIGKKPTRKRNRKRIISKDVKVIGTDIDLDNILYCKRRKKMNTKYAEMITSPTSDKSASSVRSSETPEKPTAAVEIKTEHKSPKKNREEKTEKVEENAAEEPKKTTKLKPKPKIKKKKVIGIKIKKSTKPGKPGRKKKLLDKNNQISENNVKSDSVYEFTEENEQLSQIPKLKRKKKVKRIWENCADNRDSNVPENILKVSKVFESLAFSNKLKAKLKANVKNSDANVKKKKRTKANQKIGAS